MTSESESTTSQTQIPARLGPILLGVKAALKAIGSLTVRTLGSCDRVVRNFEPWGLVLTFIGLLVALTTIMIDLEDRQSERIFRAWQVVRGFETEHLESDVSVGASGSSLRQALEFINRDFDGFVCAGWIRWTSELLTGNTDRECLFPRKLGGSLSKLNAPAVDLSGVNLSDASLMGAYFPRADLTRANFRDAFLWNADLSGADLTEARFTNADARYADLRQAILTNASFIGVDLLGANLTDANLTQASFRAANLREANFSGAKVQSTHLRDADLSGANLTEANFSGSNLTGADLTSADLQGAYLTQRQLDSACGSAAPLNIPAGKTWTSGPCP